jgi:hypothetical protein
MKKQLYEQLINNPGFSQLKTNLVHYTDKNIKLLYQEPNILSKEFVINPYIAIDYNPENESSILYPMIDFYDRLIIESELITPYDSVLLSIKDCESKINGNDILDAICEKNENQLLSDNLNFLLRKYFSCLYIISN